MTKRRVVGMIGVVSAVCIVVFVVWFMSRMLFHGSYGESSTQRSPVSNTPSQKDVLACINALPDSIKIGQKLMFAGYDDLLSDETPVLANANIGGIVIMNAATAPQLSDFKKAMRLPPFIAVDQEGGTVQRYIGDGNLPGATDMAYGFSPEQAYSKYLNDDEYLKSVGITTNFAPVVDVMSGSGDPLPGRLYSSDADTVISYASAAIRAANGAGITLVIKHFPGLGSASGNTDYGSVVTDPLSVLQTRDLVPYRRLAAARPDVMVSNAIVPELTNGQPAVWSPEAVKLLRGMGYQQAVVYSDSLTARAIPGTLAEAVVKVWQAGVDVALIVQTHDQTPQLRSNLEAIIASANEALRSGTLNKDAFTTSVARIFERKGVDACRVGGSVGA